MSVNYMVLYWQNTKMSNGLNVYFIYTIYSIAIAK